MTNPPQLVSMIPGRVGAAFEILSYTFSAETGDEMKGGRELSSRERAVQEAALETIRNFINGEDFAQAPAPRPDLTQMIAFHKAQLAHLCAMQEAGHG